MICVKKLIENSEAVNQEIASPEPVNHLKMIITGFCRTFSSITNDTFSSTVNKGEDMKVTLNQKWNDILSKFKPGRMAALGQERVIMDNILSLSPDVTEADAFAVICAIHIIVYKKIHSLTYTRKREICSQTISSPKPESLDLLYRFGGAALHSMLKKRKAQSKSKEAVTKEIEFITGLTDTSKSSIPSSLKDLDVGGLILPHSNLLPLIQEADMCVREFINDKNVKRYPTQFIKMAKQSVQNNDELEQLFLDCIEELDSSKALNSMGMHSIFSEFLSKVANIRINEFLHSRQEIDLKELGEVCDADQSLRDHLKTYSNNLRRT